MAITINDFSARIEIREPQISGRLTLFPLFAEKSEHSDQLNYLLLEEALDSGSLEIGEVSEMGNVNTVIITNMSGKPVLILDGEEILGAKQNRMVNATILIAADQKTEIPVSCVERGRWHYDTDKFAKSDAFGYSTLRKQKARQVSFNLESRQCFDADQGEIWAEIDRTHDLMGTHSPTGALHETYSQHDEELNKMVENLQPLSGQIGVAVYINNHFVCIDLFDQAATLEKLWPRLLKSYAIEALNTTARVSSKPKPEPAKIIEAIDKSKYLTYPSVGHGEDLRLNGPGVIGAGLIVEGQIIHLSVFSDTQSECQGDIGTPHRRKRNLG